MAPSARISSRFPGDRALRTFHAGLPVPFQDSSLGSPCKLKCKYDACSSHFGSKSALRSGSEVLSVIRQSPNGSSIFRLASCHACAETVYTRGSNRRGGESFARLRRNDHGILTFELDTPGRYDYLTGQTTRSYTLTSAIDPT